MENIFCLESHIHLYSRHTSTNPAYVIKTCLTWHAFAGARYWGFVSPKLHVSTYRNQQHCWWFHKLELTFTDDTPQVSYGASFVRIWKKLTASLWERTTVFCAHYIYAPNICDSVSNLHVFRAMIMYTCCCPVLLLHPNVCEVCFIEKNDIKIGKFFYLTLLHSPIQYFLFKTRDTASLQAIKHQNMASKKKTHLVGMWYICFSCSITIFSGMIVKHVSPTSIIIYNFQQSIGLVPKR